MIDKTGLLFTGALGEEGDYTKYTYLPSIDPHGVLTSWTGDKPAGGTVNDLWAIIDLGQIYKVETISLFNFNPKALNDNKDRETKSLDIWIREDSDFANNNLDGVAFNTNGWTLLTAANALTLTQYAGATTQVAAGVLTSLADVKGRFVALDINEGYGEKEIAALGEVMFFCKPLPPIPLGTVILVR